MIQIIFNAQTGEIIIEDVDGEEIRIEPSEQPPTELERLEAVEAALLDMIMGGTI